MITHITPCICLCIINPLDSKDNSATSNNTKLVHWPLMGGLLHLVQRGGAWAGNAPPSPLLAVPNVTAHSSTASVAITVLLYDAPLLFGFNVAIKGLSSRHKKCKRGLYAIAISFCLSVRMFVCSSVCRLKGIHNKLLN